MLFLLAGCGDPPGDRPHGPVTTPCVGRSWYVDVDRDGYGAGTPLAACDPPPLHADRPGDCDDQDPFVHPAATETCDGRDEDCDEAVDEDLRAWLWPDADGDGFGDPAGSPSEVCQGEGAAVPYDCDDADPALHPAGDVRFVDATAEAGLAAYVQWDPVAEPDRCNHEALGGGAAVGDVDLDGRPDLFLPRMYAPDVLLLNQGDGTFTEHATFDEPGASNGATFFDADGDGDLDLLVTRVGPEGNLLYVNDGALGFVEDGLARGVRFASEDGACALVYSASAGDADGDRDLDLHLSAWQEVDDAYNPNGRLLVNDGTGRFTDGTLAAGLDLHDRAVLASTFHDLDEDGDQDLLVAADWGRAALFENDGAGRFTDVTATAGVGTTENAMGQALGDPDGDGDADALVTSVYDPQCLPMWGCTGNRLWRNDGGLVFADATDAAGVRDGQWGWGVAFVDYDLDGHEDVVQAAGFDFYTFRARAGRVWRNLGDGTFEEGACATGLVDVGDSRAVLPFDLEGDGDPDVLVSHTASTWTLWRNDQATGRHWLAVAVAPREVGAVVRVTAGGRVQTRWVTASPTYLGTVPPEARFGLGDAQVVERIEVVLTDGTIRVATGVAADRVVSP